MRYSALLVVAAVLACGACSDAATEQETGGFVDDPNEMAAGGRDAGAGSHLAANPVVQVDGAEHDASAVRASLSSGTGGTAHDASTSVAAGGTDGGAPSVEAGVRESDGSSDTGAGVVEGDEGSDADVNGSNEGIDAGVAEGDGAPATDAGAVPNDHPDANDAGSPIAAPTALVDPRDGEQYRTVEACGQRWMAENLRYLPGVWRGDDAAFWYESQTQWQNGGYLPAYWVFGHDPDPLLSDAEQIAQAKATDAYQRYGVLYSYPAALTACPTGWHLPVVAEWHDMLDCAMSLLGTDADAMPPARFSAVGPADNYFSYPSFYNVLYPSVFADDPTVGAWLGLAPALQDESWVPYTGDFYPDIVPAADVLGLGFVGGGRRAAGWDGIQSSHFMSYDDVYRAFAWAADYRAGATWPDDRAAGILIFPVSDYPEPGSIFVTASHPNTGQSIRCVED